MPKKRGDSSAGGQWYYCLESSHSKEVIDDGRFFHSDDVDGCPECPVCVRQVSAAAAEKDGVYPSGILAVAARLS